MITQQDLINTGNLELLAKQVVEGFITGMHKSPFHGFSVEFAEHRQYNPGEATRHIDWKLFGRTDKLYVKKYEEETNLRCQLLVDCSPSMYYPEKSLSKIKFSAIAAASLMNLMKKQRDAVGLTLFSDKVNFQSDTRSASSHFRMLLNELETTMLSKPAPTNTDVVNVLHEMAEKIHRRSLIILFSDMFENTDLYEPLFAALQHLKYNKHEVVLFHTIQQKTELEFNFDNKPYLFEDIETGEKVKLFPHEVQEHYQEKMGAFYNELKFRCTQYHIDFVEADVDNGIEQILLPFLVKRQRMRG
jgi:uncharacterized protein (DUF58 family)